MRGHPKTELERAQRKAEADPATWDEANELDADLANPHDGESYAFLYGLCHEMLRAFVQRHRDGDITEHFLRLVQEALDATPGKCGGGL